MKYEDLTPEQKAEVNTKIEGHRKMAARIKEWAGEGKVITHSVNTEVEAYTEKHYSQDGPCPDGLSKPCGVTFDGPCRESAVVVWERLVQSLRRELAIAEAVWQLAVQYDQFPGPVAKQIEEFLYESCPKGYRPLFSRTNP